MTLNDLVGNYHLKDFTVTYSNGLILDSDDVISFSGTMTITSSGYMSQSFVINGNPVSVSGYIDSVGADFIQTTFNGCAYNIGIELSGNTLTTNAPMGACGISFSEIDVWEKKSTDSNEKGLAPANQFEIIPGGALGAMWLLP